MGEKKHVRVTRRRRRRDKRRQRRKIFASRYFNVFLRLTLGPYLCRRYNLATVGREKVTALKPPFVVMANHGCVWDPFFVNNYVPHPIHYVVSDSNFRSRLMDFGLSLVGSIPKTKVMSDLETVKNIVRVKDRNGIVGIFPEGQSTWDGTTLPIYFSTAKLLKVLRVPVVFARVKGAFLSRPRWSRNPRFGTIEIDYSVGFRGPELRKMPVDKVHARIVEHLSHNELDYNRDRRVRFRGIRRAEYMEIVLFLCPECRAEGTLHSHGNYLTCTACNYRVFVDEFGLFRPRSDTFHFDSIDRWNRWQIETFHEMLDIRFRRNDESSIFAEDDVVVETGFKSLPTKELARGGMQLYLDRLEIHPHGSKAPIVISISDIAGINVQNRERLEFYVEDTLYKITTVDPRGCTFKWDLSVRRIQELIGEMGSSIPRTAEQ